MTLEVIEQVTRVENECRERRASAETEAKTMIADAQRESLALLQQTRSTAAEAGKTLMRQAEERAAERAAAIARDAEAEAAAAREAAKARLDAAAEFIVGRVVKQ